MGGLRRFALRDGLGGDSTAMLALPSGRRGARYDTSAASIFRAGCGASVLLIRIPGQGPPPT
jgi:hypothetical protein